MHGVADDAENDGFEDLCVHSVADLAQLAQVHERLLVTSVVADEEAVLAQDEAHLYEVLDGVEHAALTVITLKFSTSDCEYLLAFDYFWPSHRVVALQEDDLLLDYTANKRRVHLHLRWQTWHWCLVDACMRHPSEAVRTYEAARLHRELRERGGSHRARWLRVNTQLLLHLLDLVLDETKRVFHIAGAIRPI